MRVRDLIARLNELEPDLRVIMPDEDGADYAEVASAFVDLVAPSDERFQLTDERDGDGERVVRLFGPDDD
jgi:hypothetical protein